MLGRVFLQLMTLLIVCFASIPLNFVGEEAPPKLAVEFMGRCLMDPREDRYVKIISS